MKLKISGALIFTFFISAIVVASLVTSREWSFATRLFPWAIGIPALALCAIQLFFEIWKTRSAAAEEKDSGIMDLQVERGIPPAGGQTYSDGSSAYSGPSCSSDSSSRRLCLSGSI